MRVLRQSPAAAVFFAAPFSVTPTAAPVLLAALFSVIPTGAAVFLAAQRRDKRAAILCARTGKSLRVDPSPSPSPAPPSFVRDDTRRRSPGISAPLGVPIDRGQFPRCSRQHRWDSSLRRLRA